MSGGIGIVAVPGQSGGARRPVGCAALGALGGKPTIPIAIEVGRRNPAGWARTSGGHHRIVRLGPGDGEVVVAVILYDRIWKITARILCVSALVEIQIAVVVVVSPACTARILGRRKFMLRQRDLGKTCLFDTVPIVAKEPASIEGEEVEPPIVVVIAPDTRSDRCILA